MSSMYEPGDFILVKSPPYSILWGVVVRAATTAENSLITATIGDPSQPSPYLWLMTSNGLEPIVASTTWPIYPGGDSGNPIYASENNVIAIFKPHMVDQDFISNLLT